MDTDLTFTFRGVAHECADESNAIARAMRRSRELSDLHDSHSRLFRTCITRWEEYRMHRASVDARWSDDPVTYDEEQHARLREIHDIWFGVYRTLARIAEHVEYEGVVLDEAEKVRNYYLMMLGVEKMDHSPMPEHLVRAAEQAMEDEATDPSCVEE